MQWSDVPPGTQCWLIARERTAQAGGQLAVRPLPIGWLIRSVPGSGYPRWVWGLTEASVYRRLAAAATPRLCAWS